jgi:indolepyruvate ferredoxin oxidoreductase beta subunit
LASRILGWIAREAGYDVKISEVHGMAQRGGSVVTFVRYGDEVAEPIVEVGQGDILIGFERLEALRYSHFLKKDGTLIVNDQRINPMTVLTGMDRYPEGIIEDLQENHRTIVVDAMKKAKEIGNPKVFNTVIIGVLAKCMDFAKDDWHSVIKGAVPAKTVGQNLMAFDAGYNL